MEGHKTKQMWRQQIVAKYEINLRRRLGKKGIEEKTTGVAIANKRSGSSFSPILALFASLLTLPSIGTFTTFNSHTIKLESDKLIQE